jgi:hypothetical protein
MRGRINIWHAGMAAFIVQIGWRDIADQLVERRLGVERVARIDIAFTWTCLWNAANLTNSNARFLRLLSALLLNNVARAWIPCESDQGLPNKKRHGPNIPAKPNRKEPICFRYSVYRAESRHSAISKVSVSRPDMTSSQLTSLSSVKLALIRTCNSATGAQSGQAQCPPQQRAQVMFQAGAIRDAAGNVMAKGQLRIKVEIEIDIACGPMIETVSFSSRIKVRIMAAAASGE